MNSLTYLDKKMSETIKGVLIVLIVFGHNHVLCPNTEGHGLMEYLYLFHIAGFFILPFFYDVPIDVSWKCIENKIIRTWVPYFWICILCWLCFSFIKHDFSLYIGIVKDFFWGTQTPIRHSFGFVFPWFLPTFCSFSILLIFARKFRIFYILLLVVAIVLWGMPWMKFFELKNKVPFGLVLAVSYFGSGVFVFELNKRFNSIKYFAVLAFLSLSICYWKKIDVGYLYQLFPVVFFLSLLSVVTYIDSNFLRLLGNNSLGIYLFHMFFVNITYLLLPHTIVMGVIGFFVSLLFPLSINIFIYRVQILRVLLYPRNIEELKNIFK